MVIAASAPWAVLWKRWSSHKRNQKQYQPCSHLLEVSLIVMLCSVMSMWSHLESSYIQYPFTVAFDTFCPCSHPCMSVWDCQSCIFIDLSVCGFSNCSANYITTKFTEFGADLYSVWIWVPLTQELHKKQPWLSCISLVQHHTLLILYMRYSSLNKSCVYSIKM